MPKPKPNEGQKTKAHRNRAQKRPVLGREVWLATARQALVEEGTAGVEVNKLAKRLGVSRGGFYWFFQSREQLLDALLAYWAETSTSLFERILQRNEKNGMQEFEALVDLWIDEQEYDPRWDAAVRDWARTSPAVLEVLEAVDKKRIGILEQLFHDIGYDGAEAHVRARVTYYHQVGYYALGVRESRKARLKLRPFYMKILTGREVK
jgi:AcrR family transcriptional regulator